MPELIGNRQEIVNSLIEPPTLLSNGVIWPNGRILATKAGSLPENMTENSWSTQLDYSFTVITISNSMSAQRAAIGSGFGSEPPQSHLHKHPAQIIRLENVTNQEQELKATYKPVVQSQGSNRENIAGASCKSGTSEQSNGGTQGEVMGRVKPELSHLKKRKNAYTPSEEEAENEEFEKEDKGQEDLDYVETLLSRTVSYKSKTIHERCSRLENTHSQVHARRHLQEKMQTPLKILSYHPHLLLQKLI